jgi:hypothetical protein
MIVPQFWAEARLRDRAGGRQVTVRRWGWSDESPEAALRHAEARAREALERIRAGEELPRRERRAAYNGADGAPIREEIVRRDGEIVVTRNSYGALCLNTPNVLFVDIDFPALPFKHGLLFLLVPLAPAAVWFLTGSRVAALGSFVLALWAAGALVAALARRAAAAGGHYADAERAELARVERFVAARPEWEARVYRTPAGLRVLATHRTFDPNGPEAAECFRELGADPVYARMCRNQGCFRARVSPKPWRLGPDRLHRPRLGTWPVAPQRLPGRAEWVAQYEAASRDFAACRYLTTFGYGGTHPAARAVVALHDALSRAASDLPLA